MLIFAVFLYYVTLNQSVYRLYASSILKNGYIW